MSRPYLATSSVPLAPFENLKHFSKADVDLLNSFCRIAHDRGPWKERLASVLGGLLEVPSGTAVKLQQTNEIDPQEAKHHRFQQAEIHFGRNSDCDVILDLPAIGKQHARITEAYGNYYLEDLGSAAGTYLNGRKLVPNKPALINSGDRVMIFPYRFIFEAEELWIPETEVRIASGEVKALSWDDFVRETPHGFFFLTLTIHPSLGQAVAVISSEFIELLLSRLMTTTVSPSVASDVGALSFIVSSVLENLSSDLSFPYQVSLSRSANPAISEQSGISCELLVGTSETSQLIRLFVPASTLTRICLERPSSQSLPALGDLTWPVQYTAGQIDVNVSVLSELELGDILILQSAPELLLPRQAVDPSSERGWSAVPISDDPFHIEIQDSFNRSGVMAEQAETQVTGNESQKPDLSALPVRLHVVLSQIELSLTELTGLVKGSVVELNRGKSDPVQLVANGKTIGSGELVEVEGKLGVQITAWSIK